MIGDLLAKMEAVYPSGEKAFLGPRNQNHSAPWVESVHVQGLSDIQLHHYYRALDFLFENKEAIEEQLYGQMTTLLNVELDFVFYGKTSSYFEGDCTDVEMASHG